jgi:ParB family chromosome partitioning protein
MNAEKERVKKTEKRPQDAYFMTVEEDLARHFGTKVNIKRRGQRGKVEIEFYSNEDLDRLLGLFKPE